MSKIPSAVIAAALLLAQADAAWFRKRVLRNIFDFSHREEQPKNVLKRKKVPNRVYVDMDQSQSQSQSDVNLNIDAPNMNDSVISVNVEEKIDELNCKNRIKMFGFHSSSFENPKIASKIF